MNAFFNMFGSNTPAEPQPQEPKPVLDENFIKTGEVVINGFKLHSKLTIQDFCRQNDLKVKDGRFASYTYLQKIELYGEVFNVCASFRDGKLDQITLYPRISELLPDDYETGAKIGVQISKSVAREWLIKQLGKPHEDEEEMTCYRYNWGGVGTMYTGPNWRDGLYSGGDICIGYRENYLGEQL